MIDTTPAPRTEDVETDRVQEVLLRDEVFLHTACAEVFQHGQLPANVALEVVGALPFVQRHVAVVGLVHVDEAREQEEQDAEAQIKKALENLFKD